MRHVKIGMLALVAFILVALTAVIVSDRLAQPVAPDPAALIARAAHYDVHIVRDNYGVPHIFGKTDADVGFGIGFAHSEDDFATIQDVALATRGELAASEGAKAAPGDYLVHATRVWETVNAKYDRELPADVKSVLQAYADGVNYYAALHPGVGQGGLIAADRQGHRCRLCLQDAVLLRTRRHAEKTNR